MPDTGLRERKKAATKEALNEAAIRLAVARGGIEDVHPDDIAAEAGVSTRTFHNYFPNREAAFSYTFEQVTGVFVAAVRERVQHQPVWEALREACCDMAANEQWEIQRWRCNEQIVRRSPSLITYQAGQFMDLFAETVGLVADATGTDAGDPYPQMVLGSALIAMKVANEHWLAHPDGPRLREVIIDCFAQMEAGIATPLSTSDN